jgi:hypothetical protein
MERSRPGADTRFNELRPTMPMREGKSALRLNEIQDRIGRGEYRVDTHAVADAIIRRLLQEQRASLSVKPAQEECS